MMGLWDRLRGRQPRDKRKALIDSFLAETQRDVHAGENVREAVFRRLAALDPKTACAIANALVSRLQAIEKRQDMEHYGLSEFLRKLLRRSLPFEEPDLLDLVAYLNGVRSIIPSWHPIAGAVHQLKHFAKSHSLSPQLRGAVATLRDRLSDDIVRGPTFRPYVDHLNRLLGAPPAAPLELGDPWADRVLATTEAMDPASRSAWWAFLNHARTAKSSRPSAKWLARARELKPGDFDSLMLVWLPAAKEVNLPSEDALRGLVWCCALAEEPDLTRALAALALASYRKIPNRGPRAEKIGNACVTALGLVPGNDGLTQLAMLRARVKGRKPRSWIAKVLGAAGERLGITPGQIEEIAVPDFGLSVSGVRAVALGAVTAELRLEGTDAQLLWSKAGKRVKAVPAEVKRDHAETLAELKRTLKDIRQMVPVQRDRLDRLMAEPRRWPLAEWRQRYVDHPLVGALTRKLIWSAHGRSFLPAAAGFLDSRGRPFEPGAGEVALWHPLQSLEDEILAWRRLIEERGIRQPFKQAHREVYLLTDAERETRVYSNRFAAHVLKQHQMKALCEARGWRYALQGAWDAPEQTAMRDLPAHGLRAEFWVDGIGDPGTDTTGAGVFFYVGTDQVRFYPIDTVDEAWDRRSRRIEPQPLEEVDPLVFSEVMRDVDLFVGVASVGNDAQWADGGPRGRYRDYWHEYSFGELSMTAQTRRDVLSRLVPKLRIAGRCKVTDRFLVVQGDLRAYKIHLGSGNILMEPSDRYLCIVPDRGIERLGDGTFLPFEGDRTLSVILSKALLLADDKRIKDPTILSQIRA